MKRHLSAIGITKKMAVLTVALTFCINGFISHAIAEPFSPIEGRIPGFLASAPGSTVHQSDSGARIVIDLPIPQEETPLPPKPLNEIGVFLTPSSTGNEKFRDRTIEQLIQAGGNMIVFDVKGSGVHFDARTSELALKLGLVDPKYNLAETLRVFHEHGIYTVARYIAIKDYALTDILPGTAIRHPRYSYPLSPGWIDPSNTVALAYNREIICELAASGVDEVNLDYIRYSTESMEALSVLTGEERISKLETFIKMAKNAVDECGNGTKLGLSTFAILAWDLEANARTIGQDIVRFAPYVDVFSPMAYNANFSTNTYDDPTGRTSRWYYLVYRTVRGYREILGEEHAYKVRPWIQGWAADSRDIGKQIQGVFNGGACGFMVWNAGNSYSPSYDAMERMKMPPKCKDALEEVEPELLVFQIGN